MGPGATECDARGCGRLGAWLAAVLVVALAGCAVLPRDVPSPPSHAWGDPDSTPLGRAAARQLSEHPGRSGLRLLPSGLEALAMRAGLAENAQRTLDLQYYAVHEDITTQLLLHRVLRAAQRGVRVRLLVDDLHAGGRDLQFAALAADPKVEVRVFNPFAHRGAPGVPRLLEFLHDPARLNRRMHNKLWIADNAAAIVGGRNLGDAYFDAGASLNFSDLDVLAAGPVVRELSASFDSYWNSPWAVPIEAFADATGEAGQRERFQRELQERLQAFRDTPYARAVQGMHPGALLSDGAVALVAADAVALYDPPSKSPGAEGGASSRAIFSPRLRALLEGARQEILLISPYLIPAESGMAALAAAVSRGVRVRILTNSLASTDVPAVHGGYARLRPRLLAAGAELHEMRAAEAPDSRRPWRVGSSSASLHTKAIVVDRRTVLIGSMNLDPRSRSINTEVAVLVDSPVLGAQMADLFEQAVEPIRAFRVEAGAPDAPGPALRWTAQEDGRSVAHDSEPASAWRRLLADLLALFAPEGSL